MLEDRIARVLAQGRGADTPTDREGGGERNPRVGGGRCEAERGSPDNHDGGHFPEVGPEPGLAGIDWVDDLPLIEIADDDYRSVYRPCEAWEDEPPETGGGYDRQQAGARFTPGV